MNSALDYYSQKAVSNAESQHRCWFSLFCLMYFELNFFTMYAGTLVIPVPILLSKKL